MMDLILVVPKLLPQMPESGQDGFPLPASPHLDRLLACAKRDQVQADCNGLLLELFGIDTSPTVSLPLAPIMRLAEGGVSDEAWWLRLDPVHLEPDIDKVVLQPASALHLSVEDNRVFGTLLQQGFGPMGGVLEPSKGGGWYLKLADDPEIQTVPPNHPAAGDRLQMLPSGPGASGWNRAITECQMLLHQYCAEMSAERGGLARVNSVWVWGVGRCPEAVTTAAEHLRGEGSVLQGLGRLAGVPVEPAPECATDLLRDVGATGSVLTWLDAPADATAAENPWAWREWLERLEAAWFGPCWQALRRGRLGNLVIYAGSGSRFVVSRRSRWWLWRRRRSVAEWDMLLSESR